MGRFPVLSLMYLYKSRALIAAYEQEYLKIGEYEVLNEPMEISSAFAARAGKCLRLYLNEIVSPVEMLLILDRVKHLKRVYPLTKPTAAVKGRLKSIYAIKYALNVSFEGDNIIIDRHPLSYGEKKKIATVCMCSALALTLAIVTPVTTIALMPPEGEVTRLSQIKFNSDKEYTLKRDIVVPENYKIERVNCAIKGDNHKLIFNKGASLGELYGKLSDVTIESYGDAVFTALSESAEIKGVTLNANVGVTSGQATALVAYVNYGTIDGVTVNVRGSVNAIAQDGEDDPAFGGIVGVNAFRSNQSYGKINNCTVNYSDFNLKGETSANASFGGVAGVNNGYLTDCKVTGSIIADTFDVAGICAVNGGLLSGDTNEADISQTSNETAWNPIACGIVLTNTYAVENCENKGKISSLSNCGQFDLPEGGEPSSSAAGIANISGGSAQAYIKNCTNSGDVESRADYINAYAAGVCVTTRCNIESCKNSGAVSGKSESGEASAGGVISKAYGLIVYTDYFYENYYVYGSASKLVNEGTVTAAGNGIAYAGGISARSCVNISGCYSVGDIDVLAGESYTGGIVGLCELGELDEIIFWGYIDGCISESKISVENKGESKAYIGGIAGFIKEKGVERQSQDENSETTTSYYGGGIKNCHSVNEYRSDNAVIGAIVGVCGVHIYEEETTVQNNLYSDNSIGAIAQTVDSDGSFSAAEDKGAEYKNKDEIKSSDEFNAILKSLGLNNRPNSIVKVK